ncbi:mon2 homolog, regulator of endosome-to-Golgi trafficking isoform X1 [Dermacentor variabilis]|uniref:mon2 homolog, regulator of endosome-to-Golgi trafficking isoform X1 n=1 Tax=Dermacentor variabilis TaxID=34621 RepID=UPI003F5C4DE5
MATGERSLTEKRLLENLQNDLRLLSNEAKKKHPPLKEAAESGIIKVRNAAAKHHDLRLALLSESPEILEPFFLGCDTRNPKIVQICLSAIQKLITFEAVSLTAAVNIITCLWNLMESGIEELKLLQTVTLLLTANTVVQGDALAKAIVLCFRLHFTKNSTTNNTASATVRQLVSAVFERVQAEDAAMADVVKTEEVNLEELKTGSRCPPKSLQPCAADAFLLFQDLVQMVNADQPLWLVGLTEMTRTLGLELVESILASFPEAFLRHPEFRFLLKERVCPLVIKLFSPNARQAPDRPFFPISMRLVRVVSVLIHRFYATLVTECEIFLSLVVKFLDHEKPNWQRTLALEVLHKLCSQPELLKSFCESYDMKDHSTKIFQDMVNALGAYVQALFVNAPCHHHYHHGGGGGGSVINAPPPVVPLNSGMPGSGNASSLSQPPQAAFLYRGVWMPLLPHVATPGVCKATYMEMLDRVEPPVVAEGYGVSLGYVCLLDVVHSIATVVDQSKSASNDAAANVRLHRQLVSSSWCGLLAALSLLLDASTDEAATEEILKTMQVYANLCGQLQLSTPRDAFITAMCKGSLPPHYTLTVLNSTFPKTSASPHPRGDGSSERPGSTGQGGPSPVPLPQQGPNLGPFLGGPACDPHDAPRQQVVAVGTPLPTPSLGGHQGPVMLTAKNLQCMRAILGLAQAHGAVLGSAWHLVLTTLQHLVWILGLKPSTGGSLKAAPKNSSDGAAGGGGTNSSSVITTAVMADLPVLSAMLSRLFESSHYVPLAGTLSRVFHNSQYLDDVALHHLIDALCKLSTESMELAYNNREPSLFAVAKLLETGLVNLGRVEALWRPVTQHLLEVCAHPHTRMREWGAEALTYLVKAALNHSPSGGGGGGEATTASSVMSAATTASASDSTTVPVHTAMASRRSLQVLLLAPLVEMASAHPDIRQKQLDCTLSLLHSNGETLTHGWPQVLTIIGAISESHGEALIRSAFQCLQLVVADFLPVMPRACLQLCVDTAARFGSQNQELNVSLTAVGLLWHMADYLYQNAEKLKQEEGDWDTLWMCLFQRLGELCVDPRSAVRKSAGQTLFSTINAHGSVLRQETWQAVLWQVLFPLLDRVRTLSGSASTEKVNDMGGNILIHHSRNTAQKQWAETQVLTLSGVARVFHVKREVLHTLGDFPRAWALLLEFIENSALSKNNEVSLSALKSFQEILHLSRPTEGAGNGGALLGRSADPQGEAALWCAAWKVWYNIGIESTRPPPDVAVDDARFSNSLSLLYIPSQAFLTALVQIFPHLFQHIKNRFTVSDFQKFATVVQNAVAAPVHGDASPFILPTLAEVVLTTLQESILSAMDTLHKEALAGPENLQAMVPSIFGQLLSFACYACQAPAYGKLQMRSGGVAPKHLDWVTLSFVPFGERAMEMAVSLYVQTAQRPVVMQADILHAIVKTLHVPLSMKYNCPSQSTWKLAVTSLLTVLRVGLPIAHNNEAHFKDLWSDLAATLEEFLFSSSNPPPTQSLEDQQCDEMLDCKVVQLIREIILPHSSHVPKDFVLKIVALLNKGSIHSATSSTPVDTESTRKLREEFAKACFETLLQFSFLGGIVLPEGGVVNRLAVTSLLHRFQEVICHYVEDEQLSGKCPLPRHRMAEISFVLKAVATLTASLKKAPPNNVEWSVWEQLIALYPHLVSCSTSTSAQVCRSLREALHEYADLLAPPRSPPPQRNGGRPAAT